MKLIAFIRRRDGLSPEAFHQHWSTTHAALFRDTPELSRHLRRYEQNHRLAADYLRDRAAVERSDGGFDGVAVQWFDSLDSFQAYVAEPAMARVAEDERSFMDPTATTYVLTDDADVILDKPGGRAAAGLKLICVFRRNAALTPEQFHDHWLHQHGALFRDHSDLNEPVLAYDQNHRLAATYADPSLPDVDGVTEQWFADLDGFVASLEAPSVRSVVEPDVAFMLDADSIRFILSGPPEVVIG